MNFAHLVYFSVLCDSSLSSKCSSMQHKLLDFCIINCRLFLYGIRIPVLDVLYEVKTVLKGMPCVDNTPGLRSSPPFAAIKPFVGLVMKFHIGLRFKKISSRIWFVKIGSVTFKLCRRVEVSFYLHVSYLYLMPLNNPEFLVNQFREF